MPRRRNSNTEPNDSTMEPLMESTEALENSLEGQEKEAEAIPPSLENTPSDPIELKVLEVTEKTNLKEKQSKESIEASIQEKLSRRSDEGDVDPFVPSVQLQNEVKQVAKEAGFHLSRGTEAGAALMARAKRRSTT